MEIKYIRFTQSIRLGETERSSLQNGKEHSLELLKGNHFVLATQLQGRHAGDKVLIPVSNIQYIKLNTATTDETTN